jgi:hypothetical protein
MIVMRSQRPTHLAIVTVTYELGAMRKRQSFSLLRIIPVQRPTGALRQAFH